MDKDSNVRETGIQKIFLEKEDVQPFILDIGGGGEGVIGRLYGNKVVAIDKREDELLETHDEALKIVMDATELKFIENSFERVTLFYSLMYMPMQVKAKVLEEAVRVLKPGGAVDVWDVEIPEYDGGIQDELIVYVEVKFGEEMIKTGYWVRYTDEAQSAKFLGGQLEKLGLRKEMEKHNDVSFRLRFGKPE